MPWDGTELWVADVTEQRNAGRHDTRRRRPGRESIYQPGWTPDGQLYFVSDRDGWWKLYRSEQALVSCRRERAAWRRVRAAAVGVRDAPRGFRPEKAAWSSRIPGRAAGIWPRSTRETGALSALAAALEPREWLAATATHAVVVAGSANAPDAVVRIELATGLVETLKSSSSGRFSGNRSSRRPSRWSSIPPMGYSRTPSTTRRATPTTRRPADERPPLILISHGGPDDRDECDAGSESAVLDEPRIRGGRRELRRQLRLRPRVPAAPQRAVGHPRRRRHGGGGEVPRRGRQSRSESPGDSRWQRRRLHDARRADVPSRRVHRPAPATTGSATSRCSRAIRTSSSHAISTRSSGPIPRLEDVYRARSPIHFVDRLACPLILFQGLEDKVVPPNQSEMMAAAVRAKGLPVAYLAFEGEQHGFRKAATIVRSLEAELFFYGAVFGFTPADNRAVRDRQPLKGWTIWPSGGGRVRARNRLLRSGGVLQHLRRQVHRIGDLHVGDRAVRSLDGRQLRHHEARSTTAG